MAVIRWKILMSKARKGWAFLKFKKKVRIKNEQINYMNKHYYENIMIKNICMNDIGWCQRSYTKN